METIDPSRLDAWRALLEAHARLTGSLEHDLMGLHNIPLSWYETLVQLDSALTGRMRMTDLAEAVLLSKSGLTRLIDKLVTAELVERFTDLDDRRSTLVALTEAGVSRLKEATPTYRAGVSRHFAQQLTDAEALVLTAALGRCVEAVLHEAHTA